jgi:hypothetical protein
MIFKLIIKRKDIKTKAIIDYKLFQFSAISRIGEIILNDKSNNNIYYQRIDNNSLLISKNIGITHRIYNLIKNTIRKVRKGKFLELFLFGLSFNAKKAKRTGAIDMELHMSKKLRLYIPKYVITRVFKRRLLFFSFNHEIIDEIRRFLLNMRLVNNYTGLGVRTRNVRIKIKKGKTR